MTPAWGWDELDGPSRLWVTTVGVALQAASQQTRWLFKQQLAGANLIGARLTQADVSNSVFAGAHLEHADLRKANVEEADFQGASLYHANFSWCQGRGGDFRGALLEGEDAHGLDLLPVRRGYEESQEKHEQGAPHRRKDSTSSRGQDARGLRRLDGARTIRASCSHASRTRTASSDTARRSSQAGGSRISSRRASEAQGESSISASSTS